MTWNKIHERRLPLNLHGLRPRTPGGESELSGSKGVARNGFELRVPVGIHLAQGVGVRPRSRSESDPAGDPPDPRKDASPYGFAPASRRDTLSVVNESPGPPGSIPSTPSPFRKTTSISAGRLDPSGPPAPPQARPDSPQFATATPEIPPSLPFLTRSTHLPHISPDASGARRALEMAILQ